MADVAFRAHRAEDYSDTGKIGSERSSPVAVQQQSMLKVSQTVLDSAPACGSLYNQLSAASVGFSAEQCDDSLAQADQEGQE